MRAAQEGTNEGKLDIPILPIARYRLRFQFSEGARLPDYAGSAWRGAFGHALKKAVCVTRMEDCAPCLLYRSCPYPYVFETPPPLTSRKMRKYEAAPHPFVLEPPTSPKPFYELALTLVGRGNTFLPYAIHALQQAGERGIGRGNTPMKLVDVWQADSTDGNDWKRIYEPGGILTPDGPAAPVIPDAPPALKIRFETPLRLQRNSSLVTPESFRFNDLFSSLLRRISMLTYFHTDHPLETDFAGLTKEARHVELHSVKLKWKDWTRYSSRQTTEMQMGGLVGEIEIPLSRQSAFFPYLWLGQWVHTGKGTSMGLGRYIIERQACHSENPPSGEASLPR